MIWVAMNFLLAGLALITAILISQKYFQSQYNHIENMWFGISFFLFFLYFSMEAIAYIAPSFYLSLNILQMYGYWILIIMGFRLRQIHQNWPYKLNKYIRVIVLLTTIFTLFTYHLLSLWGFYSGVVLYYHLIFIFLSFLAFVLFPVAGYYLFFRVGFTMIGVSHIISISSCTFPVLQDTAHISFILSFFGYIAVGMALFFIFYSDDILERKVSKERRHKSRRAEDKASF